MRTILLTGPSTFTNECQEFIEDFLGANFVLLYHNKEENLKHWLRSCDGVVISGGIDVHPTIYGESIWNNQNLSKFDMKRDCRELAAIEYCIQNQKPLLGICRGHQLIGIRYGMGFVMDLANSTICHNPHKSGIQIGRSEPTHSVKIVNDAFYKDYSMPEVPPERKVMADILGQKPKNRLWVNSFHHQALAYQPTRKYTEEDGITVLGLSQVDLKVCSEIIEFMHGPTWLSVQWHPEYDWQDNTSSRVILERFKALLDGQRNHHGTTI